MTNKLIGIVAAIAFASTACATGMGKGAVIGGAGGAAVGAGVGAIAGGKKGAVIGAVVGSAVGGGGGAMIGAYMDKQEKELREKVDAAKIERKGDKIVVTLKSAILFDTNKADLKSDAEQDLATFADVLKKYSKTELIVHGHTDSTGPRSFNKMLSEERAGSVVDFLAQAGVNISRLTSEGEGPDHPAASNKTATGRAQNRRVEIEIKPGSELQQQAQQAAGTDRSHG